MKIKLKIIATAVSIIVCIMLSVSVLAATPDYAVEIPKGFTVCYDKKDIKSVADIIKTDEKTLKKQFEENNTLFLAVNKDNSVQIRLSRYKTELSKKIGDIKNADDSFYNKLLEGNENGSYQKTAIGGTVFLLSESRLIDNGGEYTSKQFITVKNGYIYHISEYVSEDSDALSAQKLIDSINIYEKTVYSPKQKIIIGVCIAALTVLIGFMIWGIIKDLKEDNK